MKSKVLERAFAVRLRKAGHSYAEIVKRVPVSKSSLSLWFKEMPLSTEEKRLLKNRVDAKVVGGRAKAAAVHRANRESRDQALVSAMRQLFTAHRNEELFKLGITLYWAAGVKRGTAFLFVNSDAEMVNMMLDWLETYFLLPRREVAVRLYIHKPYAHERCEEQWARAIGVGVSQFKKTIYKPGNKTFKSKPEYKGYLRIEVTKGLALRKMQFLLGLFLDEYKKNSKVIGRQGTDRAR